MMGWGGGVVGAGGGATTENTCIKQVAQRATIAHLSPMCQGQISFKKNI